MCFSATASFVAAGAIAVVGIATLRHVRERRTLLFACIPLLFAVHQFTEGLVWLGLEGTIGPAGLKRAATIFTLYAQGLLPALLPAAVWLLEPSGRRRTAILLLTGCGAIVCTWDLYGLLTFPSHVFIDHQAIAYRNPLTGNLWISLLYIVATCGSLLVSSYRTMRWYGALNIVVLSLVELVREYAFASIWCFYAAVMSMMIYWQFRQRPIPALAPA